MEDAIEIIECLKTTDEQSVRKLLQILKVPENEIEEYFKREKRTSLDQVQLLISSYIRGCLCYVLDEEKGDVYSSLTIAASIHRILTTRGIIIHINEKDDVLMFKIGENMKIIFPKYQSFGKSTFHIFGNKEYFSEIDFLEKCEISSNSDLDVHQIDMPKEYFPKLFDILLKSEIVIVSRVK